MNEQIALFDAPVTGVDQYGLPLPPAPHNGTPTSAEAASRAPVNPQAQKILRYLKGKGSYGCTQDEASEYLGILRSACAARFNALEEAGYIKKDGERVRPTRYGRNAAVYISAPPSMTPASDGESKASPEQRGGASG